LADAEIRYSATERESLAIVWALTLLRPYLIGFSFTVEPDHSACQALFRQVMPNKRLMKWRLTFADFVFHVRYRPGKYNAAADGMSRLETDGMEDADWEDDTPTLLVDAKRLLRTF
jgi:hypothetical protein